MVAIFPNSNFLTAIIFILLIAVPFFIVLVIIHILFGGVWGDSEHCQYICAQPATNRDCFVPIKPNKTVIEVSTAENYMRSTLHPSIAALLELKKGKPMRLKCSVALLSTYLAMSTQKCVDLGLNGSRMTELRIRLGSDDWRENGIVTKVDQVLYSRFNTSLNNSFALVRFTVAPAIRNQIVTLRLPKIVNVTVLNPKLFFFNEKHKLDSIHVDYLPSTCCHTSTEGNATTVCAFLSFKKDFFCDDVEDSPLVAGNFLMGIHDLTTDCDNGLVDIMRTADIDWSDYFVPSDTVTKKKKKKRF